MFFTLFFLWIITAFSTSCFGSQPPARPIPIFRADFAKSLKESQLLCFVVETVVKPKTYADWFNENIIETYTLYTNNRLLFFGSLISLLIKQVQKFPNSLELLKIKESLKRMLIETEFIESIKILTSTLITEKKCNFTSKL